MLKEDQKVEKNKLNEINVCLDYDIDCKDVISPMNCFLGWPGYRDIGIADGFCLEAQNRKSHKG